MAWLRNPYRIRELLQIFKPFVDRDYMSEGAAELYAQLVEKNEPEVKRICDVYSINSDEYKRWIKLVIMFIYFEENGKITLLDDYVDEWIFGPNISTHVVVFYFDSHSPLLPDTAVVRDNVGDGRYIFYINVSKNLVVALQHIEVDGDYAKFLVRNIRSFGFCVDGIERQVGGGVQVGLYLNELDILSGYNNICVKAANSKVFSASRDVLGIAIE